LTVVRPLLGVTRKEVLKYLSAHGLKWREDASNRDTRFLRNRVRHELLPLLEREYNPKIRDVLRRTAEVFRAEAAGEPAAAERRAIRQLSFAQVEELRKLARKVDLSRLTGGWELKLDGKTKIKELGASFVVAAASSPRLARFNRGGDAAPTTECFDAAILGKQLFVRTWRAGDRFQPLGMKGEKKLQDFFVDEKVPRERRGRVPLLCAADGRIAWVVGYRIAEPFKVTPRTKRVLRIRFEGC
jgi:tRNA(Ile)-lysidine synthase